MKRFLIIFLNDTPSTIIEAPSRDVAMSYAIGHIASCDEVGKDFHLL